jgi:hypothetical protein
MGYLKEKYTRTYYTHRDDKDFEVGYGAAGADEWRSGGLREELRETLDLVSLKDSDILEIGYGRGESARYLFEQKRLDLMSAWIFRSMPLHWRAKRYCHSRKPFGNCIVPMQSGFLLKALIAVVSTRF